MRTTGADHKQAGTDGAPSQTPTKSGRHPDGSRADTAGQESPGEIFRSVSPWALNAKQSPACRGCARFSSAKAFETGPKMYLSAMSETPNAWTRRAGFYFSR